MKICIGDTYESESNISLYVNEIDSLLSQFKMPQDIYSSIEESLTRIEESLQQQQKRGGRTHEIDHYNKELKKVKNFINNNRQPLTEDQKKAIQLQENRIKQMLDKLKPLVVVLKPEEKAEYREKILACLRTIQKKVNALNEKKDNKKDNKKRQTNIEFFKYHQGKLSMFCQWLLSPSRKFSQQNMKSLVKYLNDLHISQDDSVFQDDLKEIYEKIIFFAEEPLEITYDMFNASFANLPKINDYLPPKQTKENSYRSSICPTYKMIDLSVIPKMPKELLFFMFYMHKNETEQYLAAKEIMRRGWRYYTRFHMWIKRCGHPNFDLAEQYETGNYFTMGTQLVLRERRGIKINHKHLINHLGG